MRILGKDVTDETIVEAGELPPTWGLLAPRRGKLVALTEAPKLEAVPLDRLMLASLLRAVTEKYMPRANIHSELEGARKSAYEAGAKSREAEIGRVQRELNQIRAAVRDYESASGLDLDVHGWNGQSRKVGAAVKLVLSGGADAYRQPLQNLYNTAQHLVRSMNIVLEEEREERDPRCMCISGRDGVGHDVRCPAAGAAS